MNLHFKEEQYSLGDSFYIMDDNNQRKYRVKSSALMMKQKWEIQDLNKNTLFVIKNDLKSLVKKKYSIFVNEQKMITITKEISIIPKYTIEGVDWQMHGVMVNEYEMLSNGQEVLSFHNEVTKWGTRPVLKVANPADELLALAMVITISYVMNAKEDDKSTIHF